MISELILPLDIPGAITSESLANYNPLAPTNMATDHIFQTLMIRNTFTCEAEPLLATGYEWTDPKTLVITLREGVKWSDGTPFTADDVVWNLEARKKYPATDTAGLWKDIQGAPATGVTADGNKVTVTFAGPAPLKIDTILGERMYMVPKHIYGEVGDLTKYVDKDPVGTGPFKVGSFNGRRLVLDRNPSYWGADQIKIEKLRLEGKFDDTNTAALKLRDGSLDVYQGDIPNPEKSVKLDGVVDYYYAPDGTTVVVPNGDRDVTGDPKFREALAYGTNKEEATQKATYGVMEPASQTMLKLPMQAADLPAKYAADGGKIPYDPEKAKQLLDQAGYRLGPDGKRLGKDGKPMSFVFSVQAGWIDYIALVDTVVRNWKALGIDIKMVATDPPAVDSMKKTGDFDFILEYVHGGCQRNRDLGSRLDSKQIADGKENTPNQARYRNPEIDQLLRDLDQTTDPVVLKAGVEKIIDIYMTEFPYLALNYAPGRIDYRLDKAVGWPSAENPYPTAMIMVVHRLRPKQ
ncbi:ABC transporter substrate-binding protein [Microlunatus parietis]|uniref:Peptide/nickel transport system substrate-binding protein n=1 Tax=Microlunatus parietis TaxID=682979 RepID=A0A7Y9I6S5_9ACTN|nr:ABC transporter substrate-binding protein [Microlunatus parietis]NYE71334.1 peptide/nickel transport system substrate-binding protein [Microlunatus parietis]